MSTRKITVLLSCLLLFTVFSCKKKPLPDPTTGAPVFFFKGNIDGQTIAMDGGVNNYYLFTSYLTNPAGIDILSGLLKDQNCSSNCTNTLQISVGDYKKRNGAGIDDIQVVLKNNTYLFYRSDSALENTTKQFQFNGPAGYKSYSWNFGDGSTPSPLQNPTYTFENKGKYNVCLTVDDGNGCSKTMCNVVNADPTMPDLIFSCQLTGNSARLIAPSGWNNYSWSLSDSGAVANADSLTHIYRSNALYDICLTATNPKNNQTETFCREINVPSTYNCASNWDYLTANITSPIKDSVLSKIVIEWVDGSGIKYNSTALPQPHSSYFTISQGKSYITNANGEKTYQFTCSFDVTLYQASNPSKSVHLTSTNCKWGVAYP